MIARRRRGSAGPELALNVALFLTVATVGWTSPSAFHDALVGGAEFATVTVVEAHAREGVPDMLATPGAVIVPLWSEPTAAERQQADCASRGKADPWATDACATPAAGAGDATPWAATPWGVE